jgi:transcription antitermination factor NusA-like protein
MTNSDTGDRESLRPNAQRLPLFADEQSARIYGARSEESVAVGDLLMHHVPALARRDLEIVAIARRVGVLSKVAVRRRAGVRLTARPVSLVVGIGADQVNSVSAELGGEKIHVLQWQGEPSRYITDALGLGYLPAIELSPSTRMANVLLGDIDVRGVRGRLGINLLLASALTQWRIRLREIARAPAWKALELVHAQHQSAQATVQARVARGLSVSIYGLNGLLPIGQVRGVHRHTSPESVDAILRSRLGEDIQVAVLRLDSDTGQVFVSERQPAGRQLLLF